MARIRVMTYNVHGCRGWDQRLVPERIVQVIAENEPDVVALQELDVGRRRSGRRDQAQWLASALEMQAHFVSARACDDGHYGNAILSRLPSRTLRASVLPRIGSASEARAAQWVRIDAPFGPLDVMNVHFGLDRRERQLQAENLLGADWLGSAELAPRAVLCGDLNASPGSPAYRNLCQRLRDAQLSNGGRPALATFPALLPFVRIDHVLVSGALEVRSFGVPSNRLARLASDHRPVVADLIGVEEAGA